MTTAAAKENQMEMGKFLNQSERENGNLKSVMCHFRRVTLNTSFSRQSFLVFPLRPSLQERERERNKIPKNSSRQLV